MRFFYVVFLTLLFKTVYSQSGTYGEGILLFYSSQSVDTLYKTVHLSESKLSKTTAYPTVRFSDPLPGGSTGFKYTISNYRDLDTSAGLLKDYNCGQATYDGHHGTDFDIIDFYEMDEGYPVLCAASGTVFSVHDGSYDRNSILNVNDTSNEVTIMHTDGSFAAYLHFRKGTIKVTKGQSVKTGDTLGLIGSSGYSTGPHLHFEVEDSKGAGLDPFNGTCQSGVSLWLSQFPYIFTRPSEVLTHGVTTIPLSHSVIMERPPSLSFFSTGDTIKSWIKIRNIKAGDTLCWVFKQGSTEIRRESFPINQSYTSSWWYTWYYPFQTSSYYGNWTSTVLLNNNQIAIDSFTYNNTQHQKPVVTSKTYALKAGTILSDSLTASDTDGPVFWFKQSKAPKNGTLTLHGARSRKITYTPIPTFTGEDTAYCYAIGNQMETGDEYPLVFKVTTASHARDYLSNNKYITVSLTHRNIDLSIQQMNSSRSQIELLDLNGRVLFRGEPQLAIDNRATATIPYTSKGIVILRVLINNAIVYTKLLNTTVFK